MKTEAGQERRVTMRIWAANLRVSLTATVTLAVLVCGLYPLLVWTLAQGLFPQRANGSLVLGDGHVVGSRLIAQRFAGPRFFHPRPSEAGSGYDAARSGGSNLGPTSRKLVDAVGLRIARYRMENGLSPDIPVPADAVTASASGLDPHISVRNALLQARRVAVARGVDEAVVLKKVHDCTEGRDLEILGEPRVNVLELNLALDENG